VASFLVTASHLSHQCARERVLALHIIVIVRP
jgi:hypothetical protein